MWEWEYSRSARPWPHSRSSNRIRPRANTPALRRHSDPDNHIPPQRSTKAETHELLTSIGHRISDNDQFLAHRICQEGKDTPDSLTINSLSQVPNQRASDFANYVRLRTSGCASQLGINKSKFSLAACQPLLVHEYSDAGTKTHKVILKTSRTSAIYSFIRRLNPKWTPALIIRTERMVKTFVGDPIDPPHYLSLSRHLNPTSQRTRKSFPCLR